jgi:serine/threonine protein kinase
LQVLSEDPELPTRLRPEVPADLETICLKCLEKYPGQRYASAEALADDLRRFQADEPISAPPFEEWPARWAKRAGYEIIELIGAGVLGLTYRARQLRLNRIVMLKTITALAQADPVKMTRFRAEAEAAASLAHPNIVQIFDFGESNGQSYCSLEFLDGGSVADKKPLPSLSASEAAALIETLARATHYAHQKGIIHCDLRPSNILLTAEGVPKITGFGLAKLLDKEEAQRDAPHTPLGLSNYMAPEQAAGRVREISPATDVHALGAMLYEALAGRPPFLAENVQETLAQVCSLEPVPPSQLRDEVPGTLERICLTCLRKDLQQRYASAETLAAELHRFLAREQTKTGYYEVIPGYELLEELGRSNLGVVHKARHIKLDRLVALKIFHDNLSAQSLRQVQAASQAAARLSHPNLLQVYDSGERDGHLYIAEELVEGTSLQQKSASAPQPVREAAQLVEVLAGAVHYVHQHGIVHSNLKPRVVLLTALGVPKISSFEQARLLGQELAEGAVENGSYSGTPTYMAPEQAAGKRQEVVPATDVYALGNILYQLLTGQPPFGEAELLELLEQIRSRPPIPPSRLQPQVPSQLETICLKCLQKEPGQRYASAEALAQDLRRFLAAASRPPRLSLWQQLVRWTQRHAPH